MHEIKDCLPTTEAKKHFIDLRNQSLEKSTRAYHDNLRQLKAEGARRNNVISGIQFSQEADLVARKIDDLGRQYLEDALQTFLLFRLPITQTACDCLATAIQHYLVASYASARATLVFSFSNRGASHLPRTPIGSLQNRELRILGEVRTRLTEARLAYERRDEKEQTSSAAINNYIQQNNASGGSTVVASQTGNVQIQNLTEQNFAQIARGLVELRKALRAQDDSLDTAEEIGLVAGAERAATERNESKLWACVKQFSPKIWDVAKVVVPPLWDLYKSKHGLP